MNRPRQDQFTGALIGCAVGDALGAPLEGRSRETIAEIGSVASRYRRFARGRGESEVVYPLGQYTDDTQLTLAIVRSLLAQGRVDGAAIADEFVKLWRSGEIVGAGPVADRAVRRLIQGVGWQEAAAVGDLPLNGAAMRIGPVGLWHCDRPDRLADDVTIASVVTHRHPVAVAAAVAVATAVAQAVVMPRMIPLRFLDAVAGSVESASPAFAGHIRQLDTWLRLPEDDALHAIAATGGRQKSAGFGIPALAVPTVLAALYAFLISPPDFEATVVTALRIGGDVDTIAAIAGAISGARNGIAGIPSHVADGVKDSAEIVDLGRRLFASRYG